jgi:hypothetical protein
MHERMQESSAERKFRAFVAGRRQIETPGSSDRRSYKMDA